MYKIELGGELGKGLYALVDDEDATLVRLYTWHLHSDGGAVTNVERIGRDGIRRPTTLRLHRLITQAQPGQHVDHRNHDRLDNQRKNLRVCTQRQNNRNQRPRTGNSSGYKGVSWHKGAGKWRVTIKPDRKQIHLGYYADKRIAALVYNAAALKHFGEYAYLNEVA